MRSPRPLIVTTPLVVETEVVDGAGGSVDAVDGDGTDGDGTDDDGADDDVVDGPGAVVVAALGWPEPEHAAAVTAATVTSPTTQAAPVSYAHSDASPAPAAAQGLEVGLSRRPVRACAALRRAPGRARHRGGFGDRPPGLDARAGGIRRAARPSGSSSTRTRRAGPGAGLRRGCRGRADDGPRPHVRGRVGGRGDRAPLLRRRVPRRRAPPSRRRRPARAHDAQRLRRVELRVPDRRPAAGQQGSHLLVRRGDARPAPPPPRLRRRGDLLRRAQDARARAVPSLAFAVRSVLPRHLAENTLLVVATPSA